MQTEQPELLQETVVIVVNVWERESTKLPPQVPPLTFPSPPQVLQFCCFFPVPLQLPHETKSSPPQVPQFTLSVPPQVGQFAFVVPEPLQEGQVVCTYPELQLLLVHGLYPLTYSGPRQYVEWE